MWRCWLRGSVLKSACAWGFVGGCAFLCPCVLVEGISVRVYAYAGCAVPLRVCQ